MPSKVPEEDEESLAAAKETHLSHSSVRLINTGKDTEKSQFIPGFHWNHIQTCMHLVIAATFLWV